MPLRYLTKLKVFNRIKRISNKLPQGSLFLLMPPYAGAAERAIAK